MAATVVYARSRPRIAYVEEWRVLDLFGGCLNSATPYCCQASVSPAKLGSARGHPSPDDAIRPPRARSPDQCRESRKNVCLLSPRRLFWSDAVLTSFFLGLTPVPASGCGVQRRR